MIIKPKFESEYHHSHIYFDSTTRARAVVFHSAIAKRFGRRASVSRLIDHAIGPHPTAMFEADFLTADFTEFVPFLETHRNGLSVLIHPVTPDEVLDHTERAIWLGTPLNLDIQFLRDFMAGKVQGVSSKIKS